MVTTEIVYNVSKDGYDIWVWFGNYCAECKAHRKSLKAARNAALRYGPIRSEK